jgi:hypothetical protein
LRNCVTLKFTISGHFYSLAHVLARLAAIQSDIVVHTNAFDSGSND